MASVENIELEAVYLSSKQMCMHAEQEHNKPSSIARVEAEDYMSYNAFFEEYLISNQPCIVGNFISKHWDSLNLWVSNGKPNFEYLQKIYGYVVVPVADCNKKYFNVQEKTEMKLSDFINYWHNFIAKDHDDTLPSFYMKDWHFTRDFPEDEVYRVPPYFASDWLNEYLSEKQIDKEDTRDDYRFIYMGPKGSWTPLHADVFMSFSWSVNVCGRKRWLLFPPGQEKFLCDKFKQLAYDVIAPELHDTVLYPQYKDIGMPYEVIQEAGEAIFVPSGWHHQVWNLDDTISINHNWVNGCNIEAMWTSMHDNLQAVKKEVDDCKEMENWKEHCQLMLRASYGMNYIEFFSFLYFIARKRLDLLVNNKTIVVFGNWVLGKKHALFDILQLKKILKNLFADIDFQMLDTYRNLGTLPSGLMGELESVLLDCGAT